MAEHQNADQEPSIEEILNSIRQIISDDGEKAEGAVENPEDVLELKVRAEDDAPPRGIEAVQPQPLSESAAEIRPAAPLEPKQIQIAMAEHEEPTEELDAGDPDPLLTAKAESAAYEGFAELARRTAIARDGITLEEIARTELRPLLKDWLNRHLPHIIERLVREELERVAKRALEE